MSNIWHDMNPKRITPRDFECVIEITKGSKRKYELDKETGLMCLVSAYDKGNGDYLEPLIESICFNRSSRK